MTEGKSVDEETCSRWNDLRAEPKLTNVVRCGFGLGVSAREILRSGLFVRGE